MERHATMILLKSSRESSGISDSVIVSVNLAISFSISWLQTTDASDNMALVAAAAKSRDSLLVPSRLSIIRQHKGNMNAISPMLCR
jgi:hypothetical protein